MIDCTITAGAEIGIIFLQLEAVRYCTGNTYCSVTVGFNGQKRFDCIHRDCQCFTFLVSYYLYRTVIGLKTFSIVISFINDDNVHCHVYACFDTHPIFIGTF